MDCVAVVGVVERAHVLVFDCLSAVPQGKQPAVKRNARRADPTDTYQEARCRGARGPPWGWPFSQRGARGAVDGPVCCVGVAWERWSVSVNRAGVGDRSIDPSKGDEVCISVAPEPAPSSNNNACSKIGGEHARNGLGGLGHDQGYQRRRRARRTKIQAPRSTQARQKERQPNVKRNRRQKASKQVVAAESVAKPKTETMPLARFQKRPTESEI